MSAPKLSRSDGHIVLGSRSPQRYELMCHLVGEDRVVVCPPIDPLEADLTCVRKYDEISRLLIDIARTKHADVTAQLENQPNSDFTSVIITADTVIVGFDEQNQTHVLGQPPDDDTWPDVVREWFERYLLRAPHHAITALCVSRPHDELIERVVSTEVTFRADSGKWLDWYLSTGEPRGKAGGYGLQGAGSLFVERIVGSPSNVIGLPVCETAEVLRILTILD